MKARAKRAVSEQAIEPSPERRRHGRIERVSRQIADQRGDPARPFRAVDTLAAMERHGTITSSMRQAADDFRRDFQIAGLDTLRAMPLTRLGGSGGALSDARLDARRRVHRALTGLGGPGSPAGSCLWHIVGLEQTLKGWALREGWCCGLALAYQFIAAPIAIWIGFVVGHPVPKPPTLDDNLWQLMFGMLGMGALRSFEKLKGVAR